MPNLFDYFTWRGDLTFGNVPLCPVDALIFSLFPYIRLESFVPESPLEEPVHLSEAAEGYFALPEPEQTANPDHKRLLREAAASARFGQLRLVGARRIVSREKGVQFAGVTVLLPGQNLFVSFEGTDAALIGWEEDFRMSYECPVPAQLCAVQYLREMAAAYPLRRIFVGGHSKGGNLAMYASVYSDPSYRDRIRRVFNNDGPGFCDDTLASPAYLEMRDRISTYLPQSSIVGVLLGHDDNYKIVKSSGAGIAQHDAYTWQVLGSDFEFAAERTAFGQATEAIIDRIVNGLSPTRKRQFVETLFSVLGAAEQESVSGTGTNKWQSMRRMLRAYSDLPENVRDILGETVDALRGNARLS